jgi:hypothetical protein
VRERERGREEKEREIKREIIDAHSLKIQGEGPYGFGPFVGGRVYRGCENFGGMVYLFVFLLHFY